MPRVPHRPAPLRRRFFLATVVVDLGLLTRKSLRSRAWRRLFRGVYADSSIEDSHRLRCAAAAAYVAPPGAVIAGRSAATLLGAGLAEASDPVEIIVAPGEDFGPVTGVRVHSGVVDERDVRSIGRLRATGPLRTCWDLARWLDVVEAVVVIDRMIAARLVTRAALEAYAADRVGAHGSRRFGRALPLVDGRAGSPPESRLRVRLSLAGFPPPEVQFSVFRQGRFLARVDLAWPELKIAIEYDGVWHAGSQDRIHADRERLNGLIADGWAVLHVTSKRMGAGFDGLLAELRDTIRERTS